jgi:hypothetical protein
MLKLKPLLMAAIMMFATVATPTATFAEEAATFPEPGERLTDKENWACGEMIIDTYEGVDIIIHDSVEMLAGIGRYEMIIYGDLLEFCGEPVLIYENGYTVKPVHEVFKDGERLTFFVDHKQGVMAELYVPFRVLKGTVDTMFYELSFTVDGKERGPGLSGAAEFVVGASKDSPYKLTREAPKDAGSVKDILVFEAGDDFGNIPLMTALVEVPEVAAATACKKPAPK